MLLQGHHGLEVEGDRRGPKGRLAKGRLATGRKQRGLKHSETYRAPIFCTLPKDPLVPSKEISDGENTKNTLEGELGVYIYIYIYIYIQGTHKLSVVCDDCALFCVDYVRLR